MAEGSITVKLTGKGVTIDEVIAALQALKEVGAPGDTPLGMTLAEQEDYHKLKNRVKNTSRATSDDIHKLSRMGATVWVEFQR